MAEIDGRKILCPLPRYGRENDAGEWESDYYVVLPHRWLLRHTVRRDKAIESTGEGYTGETLSFIVSMALAEDWNLPGLGGNPEKWDFEQFDLEVARWVVSTVLADFNTCYHVKKNWLKT